MASKECDVYHYCFFLNYSFKFQPNDYIISNIAILNIKGSDYPCIISLISKTETINLMQNADLIEKSGTL